jgi:serine O-acetyltransferase
MDDRAHLAEALLGRLAALAPGGPCGVLDDAARSGELDVALPPEALEGVPRALAAFCREFDLKLVQLLELEARGWRAVLAWGDEIGRPRFLGVEAHADWYRGATLLLRANELLDPVPGARFVHGLLRLLFARAAADGETERLDALYAEAPRAALDLASRYFPRPPDLRLVSQAARLQDWSQVLAHRARLRRAARGASPYRWRGLVPGLARLARSPLRPARAVIAFVGVDDARREAVHQAVLRDLAPAFPSGAATIAYRPGDEHWGIDLHVVLGDLPGEGDRDTVRLGAGQPLAAMVAQAHAAILGWLESRVERRFPETLVGANPPAARLLQWATRSRLPFVRGAVQTLLNCDIDCELHAPVLLPHPYGIVIERGAQVGNRVTIHQQATLAATAAGAPVVEENACIGPGARVVGAVRIGRYAVVGANAVVTRDVPSHCTVVGANRVLGPSGPSPAGLSPEPDVRTRKTVVGL